MTRGGRRYSSKLKFQVVLESLRSDLTPGQIAKQLRGPSEFCRLVEEDVLDWDTSWTVGVSLVALTDEFRQAVAWPTE